MNQITINVPEGLEMNIFELSMILASKLYDEGKLSSGQGAEMAGLSKRTFIELLGKYNTSVIGYNFGELEKDLENV